MKYIGFIRRFETHLSDLFAQLEDGQAEAGAVVKWASDKVFESYRNGVDVGKNGREGGQRTPRRDEREGEAGDGDERDE